MTDTQQEHYLFIVDAHAPEFEIPYDVKGIVRGVWVPFLLTDPASMSAIILVSVLHMRFSSGHREPCRALLQLKAFMFGTINRALQDCERACSDQLIVAVFNAAICEAVFGSANIYHVHMRGLMRMISIRGGLTQLGDLGFIKDYVARVLLWYDVNCASIVGCGRYLDGTEFTDPADILPADQENFSVGVLKS